MQCFHPVVIRGPDYSGPVSCGKCFACQSNRRRDWFMRIKYEMLHSLYSYTITLTYDEEHLPPLIKYVPVDPLRDDYDSYIYWYHPYVYRHVQLYLKRLRKLYKLRYFGVAEYGGKRGRPHYHIILFFNDLYDKNLLLRDIVKTWDYGTRVSIDVTNDDCIGYTLKYCLKMYGNQDPLPKVFMSKRPYIGCGYLTFATAHYLHNHQGDIVDTVVGKLRLPRIYRDKVYDEVQKEVNKELLQSTISSHLEDVEERAYNIGLTYDEYIERTKESFIKKCINQLKKKSL